MSSLFPEQKEPEFQMQKHRADEHRAMNKRPQKLIPYDSFPFFFHSVIRHNEPEKDTEKNNKETKDEDALTKNIFIGHRDSEASKDPRSSAHLNKSMNTTNINFFQRRYALIWTIEWRSLIMHVVVVMIFALVITLVLLFCQSLCNVQVDVKRVKMYPTKLGYSKSAKLLSKQVAGNMC
ncbi:hypothetical protein TNCV_1843101 [Trichonephila clavipes]|nr:hypothetical protein TNCV_1843101 [Trichonephila clavipes]